jgi:hypothetical protein
MHALPDIARRLNRSALYLRGLQQRFELMHYHGPNYSRAYAAWFKTVLNLRQLGISEEVLLKTWALEKKLLQLLNVDEAASDTWYLDQCGRKDRRRCRLLLTNYDLGQPLSAARLQMGIDFRQHPSELFRGAEMGEDALQVFELYMELHRKICDDAAAEAEELASAAGWGRTLKSLR